MVRIGPAVFEKKMLTDDGRQPIAIGHLSDSGDLKMFMFVDRVNLYPTNYPHTKQFRCVYSEM